MLRIVYGDQIDSCDFKNTKLQTCEGSNDYLKAYPSTFIGKNDKKRALEIKTTLTFLNLARFNDQEKSVTVFVSLMTEWNDTRLSLITDR